MTIFSRRISARRATEGCLFIPGDPVEEIKAGRDPHCGKERVEGRPYCARHAAMCYVRGRAEAAE